MAFRDGKHNEAAWVGALVLAHAAVDLADVRQMVSIFGKIKKWLR